jgi:hypothetical protein
MFKIDKHKNKRAIMAAAVALGSIIAFSVLFITSRVKTDPIGWEKSFAVTGYNIVARNSQVAYLGNYIVAAFEGRAAGSWGVFVAVSFDGGASFLAPVRVASVEGESPSNPHAAISPEGAIAVMWHSFAEKESTMRVYMATSSDLGANWSVPKKIDMGFDLEMLPRVYYDDKSRLHVFFHGEKEQSISLYHAISENFEVFEVTGSLIRLNRDMRGAFFPSILISGDMFFVAWQGKEEDYTDQIYFIKSSNYGKSWSFKKKITRSKGSNDSPSLALIKDTIYVTYQNSDDKSWAVKMLRGQGYGSKWDDTPLPVSSTNANCYNPHVVATDNDLLFVWYDNREGGMKIWSRKYSFIDKKLGPEMKLSSRQYNALRPSLVSIANRFVVFWEENGVLVCKYSDVYAYPPAVYSETNPVGQWSKLPYAILRWNPPADESGIVGYATIVNRIPDFNPNVQNISGNVTSQRLPLVEDGISYFHIRAIDGAGNFSRTVHYRLQVSTGPLPVPIVVSMTHPQGKSSNVRDLNMKWAVEGTDRLKGFVYSLSKDNVKQPATFSADFELNVKGLEEGNYFFTISAIDKTNRNSQMAIYDFIVGRGRVIDDEYLRRIAEEERRIERIRNYVRLVPVVEIQFPFNIKKVYEGSSFSAIINARNIPRENISGYNVWIGREKPLFSDKVNHMSSFLVISGLLDGEYYIGVRCRYSSAVNGKLLHQWTAPSVVKLNVAVPYEQSVLEKYFLSIIKRMTERNIIAAASLAGLILIFGYAKKFDRLFFLSKIIYFRAGLAAVRLFRKK